MPANDSFEYDLIPAYIKPTHEFGQPFGDEFHAEAVEELLLSMAGYTQRGVTLAPGLGAVPTGTIIARNTTLGLYFPYQAGATDGRQTAVGVLRDGRDTGGTGYSSAAAWATGTGLTAPTGSWTTTPASPAGKLPTAALGNCVIRGILNSNLVSGTDTVSLVSGTGGGVGQPVITALGGRIVQFGGAIAGGVGGAPFPGGLMDGQFGAIAGVQVTGVNAFIF